MAAFFVGIFMLVIKMLKGEAYELSLKEIRDNPAVVEIIGGEITPSWYALGSINTSGPDGSAAIEYGITGNISSGTVYVYATKYAGEWTLDRVIFSNANNGKRITVIENE